MMPLTEVSVHPVKLTNSKYVAKHKRVTYNSNCSYVRITNYQICILCVGYYSNTNTVQLEESSNVLCTYLMFTLR